MPETLLASPVDRLSRDPRVAGPTDDWDKRAWRLWTRLPPTGGRRTFGAVPIYPPLSKPRQSPWHFQKVREGRLRDARRKNGRRDWDGLC